MSRAASTARRKASTTELNAFVDALREYRGQEPIYFKGESRMADRFYRPMSLRDPNRARRRFLGSDERERDW